MTPEARQILVEDYRERRTIIQQQLGTLTTEHERILQMELNLPSIEDCY